MACSFVLLQRVNPWACLAAVQWDTPGDDKAKSTPSASSVEGQKPPQSPTARPHRSEGGTFLAATSTRFLADSAGLKRGTSSHGKPVGKREKGSGLGVALSK